MSDFRGARGSNTGDDYHELWATRHAIRLLDPRDPLEALAVEGLAPVDEASAAEATWDGVDCTLYEGGRNAGEADRVVLEQLKYSAANPDASWTVARLAQGQKREEMVFNRLARAWAGIQALSPKGQVEVSLVTNQQIAPALAAATTLIAAGGVSAPRQRPDKHAADVHKLAFAAGLNKAELPRFAAALRFEGRTGSRYAVEEKLLTDMASWADLELQQAVAELRRFIRNRMRPEFAGELITRESVLLGMGFSNIGALFPSPPELKQIADPVPRGSVANAAGRMLAGEQRICLHGPGGIGKTTALQQIEAALPPHSVMVAFDCYGGGSYLDTAALRHRPADAFLQLSNELATRLRLPILLGRHQIADPPRMFANRLRHAAQAYAAEYPDALIVIAVDAADNAVTAAATRNPPEACFVHDFVRLGDLPPNVRFLVTARTGRLLELELPASFETIEISPFTRAETEEHVRRTWNPPSTWLDSFHQLTAGVPRVQAYAMDLGDDPPETAIERLLPGGRSLDQVFREQFRRALAKSGNPSDLAKFCAGLIALARPVPLSHLSGVLDIPAALLVDICTDMAPAIRVELDEVRFADEDFEHFVREEGAPAMADVTQSAAAWLLARCNDDAYAGQHVAGALVAAARGSDLLELVEREPSPEIVADPVQRREAELTRLRLAVSVCREAGDPARALRFVLIGGEGLKTERALRALLSDNPDLAVRFAPDTAGRLILTDPSQIGAHGAFLLHRQAVHAAAGDSISLREGRRLIGAWMTARREVFDEHDASNWRLEVDDIAAGIDAALRSRGAAPAVEALRSWRPKRIRLEVAKLLVPRLLAEGRTDLLQAVLNTGMLRPWEEIFLLVPMTIAGAPVGRNRLATGLEALLRRRVNIGLFLRSPPYAAKTTPWVLDIAMSAAELLACESEARALVDAVLANILQPANRCIAIHSPNDAGRLDLLFRAHAVQAARLGKTAETTDLYEPRPPSDDKERRGERAYREDENDRRLREATTSIFGVYTARALALAGRASDAAEPVEQLLARYAHQHEEDSWRYTERRDTAALAMIAARSLLLLLATDLDAKLVAEVATRIHGRWGNGDLAPDQEFANRIALRPALHEMLVKDVDASAQLIRGRRIGADDKSRALVTYSRILLPVSDDDANAVFNDAVEAASQLDREILPQLRLLGSLFTDGRDRVENRRSAARDLAEVMADAAIRLEDYDGLPWDTVMETLAALDLPLALANVAKWDDADLARFRDTLPAVLKTGLKTGTLSPAEAMALDLMLYGDHQVTRSALQLVADAGADTTAFLEEAAWDSLIRHDHRDDDALVGRAKGAKSIGRWTKALIERHDYLSALPVAERVAPSCRGVGGYGQDRPPPAKPSWTRDALLDTDALASTINVALKEARAAEHYISASDVLGWAAEAVEMRDRVAFLDVVSAIKVGVGGEVMEKLLGLLNSWSSPAIRNWAKTTFPDVIVARFPEVVRYISEGESVLPRAIEWTALPPAKIVDLLLRGVELHGEALGGDQVFALAGVIAARLDAAAAADLGIWYAARLAGRIAPEDRDQTENFADIPFSGPEAVARFLYACLGDFDVRVRWRAVHAVRRLARLSARDPLQALIDEYGRRKEILFRSGALDFYWIAARLYFVLAWDRIAGELPDIGEIAGPALLAIARDESFPHVLVCAFAREACLKLVKERRLSLDDADLEQLKQVARSTLPAQPEAEEAVGRGARGSGDEGCRFHFDSLDTIPYWYDPALRGFANVSLDRLLGVAETWIIDRWGYPGEIRAFNTERRRRRFSDRDWSLASNRHGSNPILERLNTHLEWHALWCAVGELMRTEPLVAHEQGDWDDMEARIAREMLTEPPLWSADLRTPTPLRSDFWSDVTSPVPEWVEQVREIHLRAELDASDRPGYLVVEGEWRTRHTDRVETVSFSSALVDPEGATALLHALQTLHSAWDYKLPHEAEGDFEQYEAPYRLLGWLRSDSSDGGIDAQDPLRGSAEFVDLRPGTRVREACGLKHVPTVGSSWSAPGRPPMFLYEVWGERESDEERYSSELKVSGRRLLVEREQLMQFLTREELDLLVEVEMKREGRGNRRSYDSKDDTPEAAYDRVYRLDTSGGLHIAEGRVGSWTGDRPAA